MFNANENLKTKKVLFQEYSENWTDYIEYEIDEYEIKR